MLYIARRYADQLSRQFANVKQVSSYPYVLNFRCCYCGDSKKKQTKKRAYIYEKSGKLGFHCHNCGKQLPFYSFIKEQNYSLFLEMKLEMMSGNSDPSFQTRTRLIRERPSTFYFGEPIERSDGFYYVKERMIPERFYRSLYFIDDINKVTSQIDKNKVYPKQAALVIPFFDRERNFSYICFRFLSSDNDFRYLLFQRDESLPKMWGIEFVDWSKPVYIFEGAIDAMMVNNSLAMSGTTCYSVMAEIKSKDICFVYDNELRDNKSVCYQVQKRIEEGYKVFIPDQRFSEKDANKIITSCKMTKDELCSYIEERTFSGLMAKLELSYHLNWRKK